ncbi:50S ribosomal protein L10, partial [Halobacteriales archaeon SW_12_69_24]
MSAESDRTTGTIPEWKREEVDEIVEFLQRYDSVGVVDVTGIPSRQLQDMRRELHGTAALRISRNTLIALALEEIEEGLEELVEHVAGQVGLIGTNDNPFGLYQQLEASKTPAPINAGETAPDDVVIPGGDTGIDPGPFVGDLQQVGANARIEGGSIKVVEDSTVLSAGEEVSADLSNVLSELGIEPKEVGLDLRSVHSEGVLFAPAELDIDVEAYHADLEAAAAAGHTLSIDAGYPTARTGPVLLSQAAGDAKAVGVSAAVESPSLTDDLVSTADAPAAGRRRRRDGPPDEKHRPGALP